MNQPFDLGSLLTELERLAYKVTGNRRMLTREYAELSLRLGVTAAKIDDFFGTQTIAAMLRRNSLEFTPDMLTTLEDGAIRLGVPRNVIDEARTLGDQLVAEPAIRHLIDKRPREGDTVQ